MTEATMAPRTSTSPGPGASPDDPTSSGSVDLEGLGIAPWSEMETVDHVMRSLGEGRGGWMVTVNLDILRQVVKVEGIRELVGASDLKVADGMPLLWAARLQGTPLPERVCGSNLIHSLPAAAAPAGRSIFLLGGDPGTAEAAADALRTRHPDLRIAGTHCPEFGFERDPERIADMERRIAEASPDIVFVALGFPKQERLVERIRAAAPQAWWIGVGISFSFASGQVKRAPRWVQSIGLEWVHRILQEPRRLFVRYVVHDIPFGLGLLGRAIARRGRLVPKVDR
jgi:N-acetylglucosaminyldiphosphoundecaprenol N-acetyl-beta-D-mannosaminyltransferase